MTKMTCELADKNTTTQCSTGDPHYFETRFIWGGKRRTRTECLNHAIESERQGKQVNLILT
jgi:hypothetical protein